jgi:hypothetical protein
LIFIALFYSFHSVSYADNFTLHTDFELNNSHQFNNIELNTSLGIDNKGNNRNELWLVLNKGWYDIILGRRVLSQGPGYFSQLMLSEQGPPLDMVMTRSNHKLFAETITAEQLIAYLDEGVDKQLFVHRLESETLIPNMKIGISESMMTSKLINPAYYLPVPFWPYYLTAKLSGIDNDYNKHEDKYIGLDFTYTFDNNTQVYGELLVDEYPQHSWANNPDKRAHLLGLYYPYNANFKIRAEYSNVFNNVYQHRYPANN